MRSTLTARPSKPFRKTPASYNNLGRGLHAQGKLDEAIDAYRQAIEVDRTLFSAQYNLGGALWAQGKLDEAIDAYRQAIELDPKIAGAYISRGNVLCIQNKLDEAIGAYRQAIKLDPKSALAYKCLANAHVSLAHAQREQKKWDQAILEYREAIRLQPEHADAHYQLGQTLRLKGAVDDAIDFYKDALKHTGPWAQSEPRLLARIQRELYALLHEAGRYPEAETLFNQARAGWEKPAEKKELNPRWELAWFLVIWPDPNRHDARRAIELAEQLVKEAPTESLYWRTLGAARVRARDWPAAIVALEKANDLERGGSAWMWFFLAMARWENGDKDEARRWYDRAAENLEQCRLHPDIGEILQFQAEARKVMGIRQADYEVAPPPREK